MRTLGSFTRSTLLLTLASAPLMYGQPDPNQPYVKSIAYGGTGCPQGSVGTSFSNSRQSFTLIFDSFVASSGPGVAVTESRKTCQITVRLHLAPGWQTWIQTAQSRGYVQLPDSVEASAKATYNLPAPSGPGPGASGVNKIAQSNFSGPVAKDYLLADGFEVTAHAPNTCNDVPGRETEFTMLVEVSLQGPAVPAQITTDSIDAQLLLTARQKNAKNCP